MIRTVAEALKPLREHPLVLALILINVIFLAFSTWLLSEVSESRRMDQAAMQKIITDCLAKP
jgi:hypothetical protein